MVSFRVFGVKNSANTTVSEPFSRFEAYDEKGTKI
jgi:hypothetical protein